MQILSKALRLGAMIAPILRCQAQQMGHMCHSEPYSQIHSYKKCCAQH